MRIRLSTGLQPSSQLFTPWSGWWVPFSHLSLFLPLKTVFTCTQTWRHASHRPCHLWVRVAASTTDRRWMEVSPHGYQWEIGDERRSCKPTPDSGLWSGKHWCNLEGSSPCQTMFCRLQGREIPAHLPQVTSGWDLLTSGSSEVTPLAQRTPSVAQSAEGGWDKVCRGERLLLFWEALQPVYHLPFLTSSMSFLPLESCLSYIRL